MKTLKTILSVITFRGGICLSLLLMLASISYGQPCTVTITPSFGQAPYTYGWADDLGNPIALPDPCTDRDWANFGPLDGIGASPIPGGVDNSIVEDAINSQPFVIQGAVMTVNDAVFNGGAIIEEEIINDSHLNGTFAIRTGVDHDQIIGGIGGANIIRTITFSQPVCDLRMLLNDMDNNDVAIVNPKLNGTPYAMAIGTDFGILGTNVNFVGGNQFESAADIGFNNTTDGAVEFTFSQCIDEIEIIFYDDVAGPGVFASIGGSYSINFPPACDYTASETVPAGCYDITVFDTNGDSEVITECVSTCNACTLVFESETVTCNTVTDGVDIYTVSIPFDNGTEGAPGAMNYTVSTSGTLSGDNPMTTQSGVITIIFNEGTPYDYNIQGTAGNPNELCDFSINGASPTCDIIAEIPTVGEWGLIILALLMSIVAMIGIRERKTSEINA